MSPSRKCVLYSVHYILDARFRLRLEKLDDSLEKVNGIIESRIELTYGSERVECFMFENNFRIFARG